jgi:microcin C transport system permease protein
MSGMVSYFIRRLLLVPITFVIITMMVYGILRVVPGGPVEQAEAQMKLGSAGGEVAAGGGGVGTETDLQLDEDGLKDLQRYYSLDRPMLIGYLQWLGAWPRDVRTRVPQETMEEHAGVFDELTGLNDAKQATGAALAKHLGAHDVTVRRGVLYRPLADGEALPEDLKERADELLLDGFGKRDELLVLLAEHGYTHQGDAFRKALGDPAEVGADAAFVTRAEELLDALHLADALLAGVRDEHGFEIEDDGRVYQVEQRFRGILQLDFGSSYTHSEPVLGLIFSKFEISLQFGLTGFLLSWLICVPLGVFKAIKHRSAFDTLSSLLVFLGYAMPGFVVCLVLLATVAGGWLPLGGYKPDNIDQLSNFEAFIGRVRHMIIPITGYMIGGFATMTILMKNSLMENLGQDYVRTAFAKGLPERRVIFIHALRNSMIPITAGIGHAVGLLFAGSFLIEVTCNIPGMGLLGFHAIIQRDFPIVLGILVFGVLIRLFGNIFSDVVWALIDPRIRFQ